MGKEDGLLDEVETQIMRTKWPAGTPTERILFDLLKATDALGERVEKIEDTMRFMRWP